MLHRNYNHLFKILIVGDSGVGKTAILQRYCADKFSDTYNSTVGVDFKPRILEVGGKTIKLQIWDTAGQERFMNITSAYFRNTTAVLIVYDVNNRETLQKAYSWFGEVKEKTGQNKPIVMMVGNKKDESINPLVGVEEAKKVAASLGDVKVMECSAKDSTGVTEIFGNIVDTILERMGDDLNESKVSKYIDDISATQKKRSSCC